MSQPSLAETLTLAQALIDRPSITPEDAGCQELLITYLKAMGFSIDLLPSGNVKNFWARRGTQGPLLVFAGHTDVVPPGTIDKWHTPPFVGTVREGRLYGRGAADMKSALAAMIISCQYFIQQHPNHSGSIGLMITSDEEGEAKDGTVKILEHLKKENIQIDWCIIGEASSDQHLGDIIKVGRRGSLHGALQVFGKQGHIAYPHLADNPIHRSFKALEALTRMEWDTGNEFFTPTTFQIYQIQADTGASNIIPGVLNAHFNFRYSPSSKAEELQQRVHKVLDDHQLNYNIEWKLSGKPFLSPKGKLRAACTQAIFDICQIGTHPNTTGGTSDGRFIAETGCEIVELGPSSKSIHQVNEHIRLEDLEKLPILYLEILKQLVK